mmetsp:Transcript_7156/g.13191  ORF Transcript_7156/g.13191 Transcript_7156/m.13191 type:complete len:232 (+) Transcript_7156:129-824(+)
MGTEVGAGVAHSRRYTSSMAMSPWLPAAVVALKRQCVISALVMETEAYCHESPWSPALLHCVAQLTPWSLLVSNCKVPMVAPYMWYQNVALSRPLAGCGLSSSVWPKSFHSSNSTLGLLGSEDSTNTNPPAPAKWPPVSESVWSAPRAIPSSPGPVPVVGVFAVPDQVQSAAPLLYQLQVSPYTRPSTSLPKMAPVTSDPNQHSSHHRGTLNLYTSSRGSWRRGKAWPCFD